MTNKVVYCVERDCMDPFFEPHLVAIFSEREIADEWVKTQPDNRSLNVSEWVVDDPLTMVKSEELKREDCGTPSKIIQDAYETLKILSPDKPMPTLEEFKRRWLDKD